MKTILLTSLLLIGISIQSFSQKVDTTFYDKDWQGVKFKELAEYIRYDFNFNDPNYNNKARVFWVDGKLEREGIPLQLNRLNGLDSKWKNTMTSYYRNGEKKQESKFNSEGIVNGKVITWNEGGKIMAEENFENGILNGPSTIFSNDNSDVVFLTFFENGKPKNNETLVCFPSGKKVRIDYDTKKVITIEPSLRDCNSTFKDGLETLFYDMNGIYLGINYARENSYGKYYRCYLHFVNNTTDPIIIDPEQISGLYIKGNDSRAFEMMPAEEYLAKIARSQAFSQALSGFASGMSTYNAGYSTTNSSGLAVGSGGWATANVTTTTYNQAERQAILNQEQQKLQNQADNDKRKKDAINGELLKKTVVEPGEEIVKTFYVKYLSADKLNINIEISNYQYPFICEKLKLFWPN